MHLDGLLFFPVTPFGPDGALRTDVLAEHVRQGVAAGAGAVFAACGTGELPALEPGEYERAVVAAVDATGGRVPVFAGAGGALPIAQAFGHAARRAGADGVLLLPPYLVSGPPAGMISYVRQVVDAAALPTIVYQRPGARFTPATLRELVGLDGVIGFKDGVGDIDLLVRLRLAAAEAAAALGRPFPFFNGLPTAELTQPAYRALGVRLYSSAVFCFAPEIALAYWQALEDGDQALVDRLLAGFYRPFVELRDQVPGYAVALVKAGVRLRGLDVGGVRAPLVDATAEHVAQLAGILEDGLAIVAAAREPAARRRLGEEAHA